MAQSEREASSGGPGWSPSEVGIGRLFDQVRDAVIVSDADGRVLLWNPAACSLFGYESDEMRGRNVREIVPERLRARHDAGMRRFRETGTGSLIQAAAVLELPALRKDGTELMVELTLSNLERGLVMAIVRDVTERVRLREASEADRRRLREANEALESFSYVVGHDLKEPVRAVDVYLETLADDMLAPDAPQMLERARAANQRVRSLLEGLIEWSRATMSLELVPIDLRDVLDGPCRARYQHVLQERRARVEVDGSFPRVLGSEGLLCQIFGNLILNALRHNPRPDPVVRVLALGEKEGLVTVAVRDNGEGFPPEVKQRMERMRATRPTTVRGGFGMTIALRATHLLGGRMELGDAPGGGAEVRVRLPLA